MLARACTHGNAMCQKFDRYTGYSPVTDPLEGLVQGIIGLAVSPVQGVAVDGFLRVCMCFLCAIVEIVVVDSDDAITHAFVVCSTCTVDMFGKGFPTGLVTGMLGLLIKPTAGLFKFVSNTSAQLRTSVTDKVAAIVSLSPLPSFYLFLFFSFAFVDNLLLSRSFLLLCHVFVPGH